MGEGVTTTQERHKNNTMKITTKGRYGARVMLDLALRDSEAPTPLRKLAGAQDISAKYLEQILLPLMSAGLVKSVRGARGGYLLARPADQIHLYDIVRSLEGPLAPVECVLDAEYCDRVGGCVVHLVWGEMEGILVDFLSGLSLADLAARQKDTDLRCPPPAPIE